MADLNDTGAPWPAGIYQIEQTDPVLGGAPNVATGAGMSNIPHLQLAQRTQVLKGIIDASGLGAAAVPLVTLNSAAARLTGSYRFASSDPSTPAAGVAGTVDVIAASASAVTQVACSSATGQLWVRVWNGVGWSTWSTIWQTLGVTQSLVGNGWQRLPSGLIVQWGLGANYTSGFQNITLPMTFAAIGLRATVGTLVNEADPTASNISFVSMNTTTLRVYKSRADTIGGTPTFIALGV